MGDFFPSFSQVEPFSPEPFSPAPFLDEFSGDSLLGAGDDSDSESLFSSIIRNDKRDSPELSPMVIEASDEHTNAMCGQEKNDGDIRNQQVCEVWNNAEKEQEEQEEHLADEQDEQDSEKASKQQSKLLKALNSNTLFQRKQKNKGKNKGKRGRPSIYAIDPNLKNPDGSIMSRYLQLKHMNQQTNKVQPKPRKTKKAQKLLQLQLELQEEDAEGRGNEEKEEVEENETLKDKIAASEEKQRQMMLRVQQQQQENESLKRVVEQTNSKCSRLEQNVQNLMNQVQLVSQHEQSFRAQVEFIQQDAEGKVVAAKTQEDMYKLLLQKTEARAEELTKIVESKVSNSKAVSLFFEQDAKRQAAELAKEKQDKEELLRQIAELKSEKRRLSDQVSMQEREKNELSKQLVEQKKELETHKRRFEDTLIQEKEKEWMDKGVEIFLKLQQERMQAVYPAINPKLGMVLPFIVRGISKFCLIENLPEQGMPSTPDVVWFNLNKKAEKTCLSMEMFKDETILAHLFCVVDVLTNPASSKRPLGSNQNLLIMSFSVIWVVAPDLAKQQLKESFPQSVQANQIEMTNLEHFLARVPHSQAKVAKKIYLSCYSKSLQPEVEKSLNELPAPDIMAKQLWQSNE